MLTIVNPNLKFAFGLVERELPLDCGFIHREHPKDEYFIEVEDDNGLFDRREGE